MNKKLFSLMLLLLFSSPLVLGMDNFRNDESSDDDSSSGDEGSSWEQPSVTLCGAHPFSPICDPFDAPTQSEAGDYSIRRLTEEQYYPLFRRSLAPSRSGSNLFTLILAGGGIYALYKVISFSSSSENKTVPGAPRKTNEQKVQ